MVQAGAERARVGQQSRFWLQLNWGWGLGFLSLLWSNPLPPAGGGCCQEGGDTTGSFARTPSPLETTCGEGTSPNESRLSWGHSTPNWEAGREEVDNGASI